MLRLWLSLAFLCAGTAGAAAPSYSAAGIVNASDYSAGPFAPNSVISIFGEGLARSTHALAIGDIRAGRLPVEMNSVRVYVENQVVPLLYVSEGQINFLIPSNQNPGTVRVRVTLQGLSGPEISVQVVDCAPALFSLPDGYAIATSAKGDLLTADAPAHPGDVVVIYMTGLGKTTAHSDPDQIPIAADWIRALSSLKIRLGAVTLDPALIWYAGVTPGSGGLYQVNIAIPEGTGEDPEVAITGNTVSSGLKLPLRPADKSAATFVPPGALNL